MATSEDYKQEMWAGKSSILVALRCRPITMKEKKLGQTDLVTVVDGKVVIVADPGVDADDPLRQNRTKEKQYAFDCAFGSDVDQETVYRGTTSFLIDGVINGYNASVFAYGATGAGKTFTMLGTPENPGIMIRTLRDLFKRIEAISARGGTVNVSLSYVEIYNENIRDLIAGSDEPLDLREDPIKGPTVAGVLEVSASSTEEVMDLLAKGNKHRTQEPTAANKESSRSHAVLQILVELKERNGTTMKIGKLSLIDLAGSERASNTKNSGIRLKEGANINRSLLALGNCINALTQNAKGQFVPYRDSKLTRLLKDSLGGNCRTVMIAAIAPNSHSFEETINTLKYANRAKNIKTNIVRNVLNVDYHISEYENLITGLRSEIADLKGQLASHGGSGGGIASLLGTRGPAATRGHGAATPEQLEIDGLRDQLVQVFQERMQLQRSIIDLQSQNVQNNAEISRRNVEIARLEDFIRVGGVGMPLSASFGPSSAHLVRAALSKGGAGGSDSPRFASLPKYLSTIKSADGADTDEYSNDEFEESNVKDDESAEKAEAARKLASFVTDDDTGRDAEEPAVRVAKARRQIAQFERAIAENNDAKKELLKRLQVNARLAEDIRNELASKTTSAGMKEILELEYKVGLLELENMELEYSRMLHDLVVRRKDMKLRKFKLMLGARDRYIDQLEGVLRERGLEHLVSREAVDKLDAELNAEEELEEQYTQKAVNAFESEKMPPLPPASHKFPSKPKSVLPAAVGAEPAPVITKSASASSHAWVSGARPEAKKAPEVVKFPPLSRASSKERSGASSNVVMGGLRRPSSPIDVDGATVGTESQQKARRYSSLPMSPPGRMAESPKSVHSARSALPTLSPLRDKGKSTSPPRDSDSDALGPDEMSADAVVLRGGRRAGKLKHIKSRAKSFRDRDASRGVAASDDDASPRRRRSSRQAPASREFVAVYSEHPAPRLRARAQALRKQKGIAGSLKDVNVAAAPIPKIAPAPTPIAGVGGVVGGGYSRGGGIRPTKPANDRDLGPGAGPRQPSAPSDPGFPSVASEQGLRRFRSYAAAADFAEAAAGGGGGGGGGGGIHRSASAVGTSKANGHGAVVSSAFPPNSPKPGTQASRLPRPSARAPKYDLDDGYRDRGAMRSLSPSLVQDGYLPMRQ